MPPPAMDAMLKVQQQEEEEEAVVDPEVSLSETVNGELRRDLARQALWAEKGRCAER